LGVDLTLPPEQVRQVALEAGITFCFANAFHPAMRHAAPARSGLGVATAFNLLGPLTNPAQPTWTAVGVADKRYAPIIAGVFASRGTDAAVFRGRDGLDELTVSDVSDLWWVRNGEVSELQITPEAVGVRRHPLDDLRGGDAVQNAAVVRAVLSGEEGAARQAVLLNAGAALAVASGRRGRDVGGDHGSHCRWGAPGGGDDRFGCGPGHPRRMGRRHSQVWLGSSTGPDVSRVRG
jgi:anthranilate phosphoribosyltransferase